MRSCDVLCALFALLAGGSNHIWTPAIIFLYAAYSYMRSTREACIAVFFMMLCALSQGVVYGYFYALGFTVLFISIHMIKLLNQNLYQWMPFVITVVIIPYSLQQNGLHMHALVMPVMVYGILMQVKEDYHWVRRSYVLSQAMYGVLILAVGCMFVRFIPNDQASLFLVCLLLIACVCNAQTCFLLGAAICFLVPIHNIIWIGVPFICSLFKKKRMTGLLLLMLFLILYASSLLQYIYVITAMLLLIIVRERYIPLLARYEPQEMDTVPFLSPNNTAKRQMQNYAGIFQSLAEYYASINDVEADVLGNMASALQYHAQEIQKIDDIGKDHMRLRKALEGYQYAIDHIDMEEFNDGRYHLSLQIGNIKRGEIRTTLQPLLEALLHRRLYLETLKSHRFTRGFSMDFSDFIPFEVDAYADSLKNSYTSSGDSFSIFRFRQSTICMISDGMGNGEKAAKSSQLISGIFQRMMISGMSQDSAIRCINKLVQSDTYATLDVICFDRSKGVAYISKSAACPTFLLRNQKIYEISGNALPVGIISQMQPDCFELDMNKGDEFLMISDGVEQSEIYTWLKERSAMGVRDDVEAFIQILMRKRRKDDSTLILARINET